MRLTHKVFVSEREDFKKNFMMFLKWRSDKMNLAKFGFSCSSTIYFDSFNKLFLFKNIGLPGRRPFTIDIV